MTGYFDDHDDLEFARKLRRVAGATPDVYVAYDDVTSRVGLIRRRRRMAATGTAAVALVFAAGSYALNLRSPDHRVQTASATTDETTATTEPIILGDDVGLASTTLEPVEAWGGTDDPDVSEPTTTIAPQTTDSVPASVSPTTVAALSEATTQETLPVATESTVATTLAPPTTKPPTTKPPAPTHKPPTTTAPPVLATTPEPTVAPTDPPVETTVAPPTPETTPPPTVPVTDPPTTTTIYVEPDLPVPVSPKAFTSPEGNTISVVYQNGQLSWVGVQPADGWTVVQDPAGAGAKKLRAVFTSPDGVTVQVLNAFLDKNEVKFSVG